MGKPAGACERGLGDGCRTRGRGRGKGGDGHGGRGGGAGGGKERETRLRLWVVAGEVERGSGRACTPDWVEIEGNRGAPGEGRDEGECV